MDTPGIHSEEQVAGWRRITDAVHEAGGLIAAQLWHVGRVSHESFHGGELPVSASDGPYRNRTTVRGEDGRPTRVSCPVPRAARPRGDPAAARGLPARDRQRPRGRLRPRRDPRRPRLPAAPVPGRRQQPAHRRVRRLAGQPRPPDARGHRRRRRRLVAPTASPSGSPRSARSTAPRTPRAPRRGCTSPASSAAATSRSCTSPSRTGPAARSSTTTTAAPCARPTPAPSSGPAATTSPRRSDCSVRASSTPPPSAGPSSPTPTCRAASPRACPSTRRGPRRSTAATPRATPTTRRTARPEPGR